VGCAGIPFVEFYLVVLCCRGSESQNAITAARKSNLEPSIPNDKHHGDALLQQMGESQN